MTTFALAPRPPPRDASPECSSSSSDATRPRPPRPRKGPRAGRTHRLASRTKAAPTDGGKNEENVRASSLSFAKTMPAAFAPRPPAHAFAPEEDVERSALLRAVRDAENESVSPKRTPLSLERRKLRVNASARRFGDAFDGNRPRTPPEENESKKKVFRRASKAVAKGRGRTGGGGGVDVFRVTNPSTDHANGDSSPKAPTRVRTRERFGVVSWAPGGSAGVRAWGDVVGKTASPESHCSRASVSRESSVSNEALLEGKDEKRFIGQRTARAIDALRSTRRRAWSADASPYAASLSLTGTLPPARGAKPSSLASSSSRRSDSLTLNAKTGTVFGTPPKTLRARLERQKRSSQDWERKCAEAEVERDALKLDNERKDDAIFSLTKRLAEAEERARQPVGCVSPVAEHLEAASFRYRRADGKENVGDALRSTSPKPNQFAVSSPSGSPGVATSRSPVSGLKNAAFANEQGSSPVRIKTPPSCGGGAVVEDSPPSAFFAFFLSSPSRELDGVPAWSPAAAASPGTSPPGTGTPPAPVPAADITGVLDCFEVGGALSEDEDGGDIPGDGLALEPRTPPAARSRTGEDFKKTAEADPAEALASVGEISTATKFFASALGTKKTPSTPSSRASPVTCASCVAVRLRHESMEASCNALREALRTTRQSQETLESEKESLAIKLANAETDLADALAALHFERLDSDGDGLLTLDDLLRAELFASYAQPVVERIFEQWTHSRIRATSSDASGESSDAKDKNNATKKTHDRPCIDADGFRLLRECTERKSRSPESTRFWFRVVDVDGDGVLSRHDIKWLYDAVYKDETTCVSLEDLTCQIFDMAGADLARGGDALRGVITCAALRGSRLADGIFGILCNHDDMLLRRSTAEFSNEHAVPM